MEEGVALINHLFVGRRKAAANGRFAYLTFWVSLKGVSPRTFYPICVIIIGEQSRVVEFCSFCYYLESN